MLIAIIILSLIVLILAFKVIRLEKSLFTYVGILDNALKIVQEINNNNEEGHRIIAEVLQMIKTFPCLQGKVIHIKTPPNIQEAVEEEIQINNELSKSTNNKKQKKSRNTNVKVDINEKRN